MPYMFSESMNHVFFKCGRIKEIWSCLAMTQIIEDTCFEVADGIGPPERLLMDENAAPYLVGV